MVVHSIIGKISKLAYTPVKSTALCEVSTLRITPYGIEGDREWVIVQAVPNEHGVHRWISHRDRRNHKDTLQSLGIIARIQPHLTSDTLSLSFSETHPILFSSEIDTGKKRTIQIWEDIIEGTVDQGDEVAAWLSDRLNHPVRLVKVVSGVKRPVSSKYFPNTHSIKGQDSYPLHWITQESLDDLSKRAKQQFSWKRFRPNIVVEGTPEPGYEHRFFHGFFGALPIVNAKPCDRCSVPLVDQETGKRTTDGEPLKTLKTYKEWRKPSGNTCLIFGEMSLPERNGEIAVGQEVRVVDFRNPPLTYGHLTGS